MSRSGSVTVAFAVAYSMMRSAKSVAGTVERAAPHPLAQVGAQRGEVVVGPDGRREVVVSVGQAPLAQLPQRRRERRLGWPASSSSP